MLEPDSDFELGDVTFSRPLKPVPARKFDVHSQRYKSNFYPEMNQRYSSENDGVQKGSSKIFGIDEAQFSLSFPPSHQGYNVDMKNQNVWVQSNNDFGNSRLISSNGNDSSMKSFSSDDSGSLNYRPNESAFRLIESSTCPSLGSSTSYPSLRIDDSYNVKPIESRPISNNERVQLTNREFARTPGPKKAEFKEENNSNDLHTTFGGSYQFSFATPGKLSDALSGNNSQLPYDQLIENSNDPCSKLFINPSSLSPDVMNIVSQILTAQSSSSDDSFYNSQDNLEAALNIITRSDYQEDGGDLLFGLMNNSLNCPSSEAISFQESISKHDHNANRETLSTSFPPGLYEYKQESFSRQYPGYVETKKSPEGPSTLNLHNTFFPNGNHNQHSLENLTSSKDDFLMPRRSREPAFLRTAGHVIVPNHMHQTNNFMETKVEGYSNKFSQPSLSSLSSSYDDRDFNGKYSSSGLHSSAESYHSKQPKTVYNYGDFQQIVGPGPQRRNERPLPSLSGELDDSLLHRYHAVQSNRNSADLNELSGMFQHGASIANRQQRDLDSSSNDRMLGGYYNESQGQISAPTYSREPQVGFSRQHQTNIVYEYPERLNGHSRHIPPEPLSNPRNSAYPQQSFGTNVYQGSSQSQTQLTNQQIQSHYATHMQQIQMPLQQPRYDRSIEPKQIGRNERYDRPQNPYVVPGQPVLNTNSNGSLNRNPLQSSSDSYSSKITPRSNSGKTNNFSDNTLRSSKDSIRDSKEMGPMTIITNNNANIGGTSNAAASKSVSRPEFVESPRSKSAYKEFYKQFKQKEKVSVSAAKSLAIESLSTVPENAVWRIYLELADLAKRNNLVDEATKYYGEACRSQPRASMSWLEWSKMEEENGELRKALNILVLGLNVCKINEALLTRVIKLHERLQRFNDVRGMLSVLKYESIDKVWKSVLEGTLFEARTGNIATSRKLFKYLMTNVSWYGPIYYEAFRLEEKEDCDQAALDIIRRGLAELPRYGPLWFGLMRIVERMDTKSERHQWGTGMKPQLIGLKKVAADAIRFISKELTWKVHFEKSQCEERAADVAAQGMYHLSMTSLMKCREEMLEDSRVSLTRSILVCPPNLRWKILLVGARLELSVGTTGVSKARQLLGRAFAEVPEKSRSYVYLECSRLEELVGSVDLARDILKRAATEMRSEWKIFLEAVLLEMRAGNILKALHVAHAAVQLHPGTGRLWAIYIQLSHRYEFTALLNEAVAQRDIDSLATEVSPADTVSRVLFQPDNDISLDATETSSSSQQIATNSSATFLRKSLDNHNHNPNSIVQKDKIIRRAITEVPKSGEVWCEKCRCHLNPLSTHQFDLRQAQRSLCFAIQFTPQYGDTFIECIRLEMICQVLLPRVLEILGIPLFRYLKENLQEDSESDIANLLEGNTNKFKNERVNASFDGTRDSCDLTNPVVTVHDDSRTPFERQIRRQKMIAIERMQYDFGDLVANFKSVSIAKLNRRCVNADPNYGSAWFHCRIQPYDIPSYIIKNAINILVHEMVDTQKIYSRALLHSVMRWISAKQSNHSSSVTATTNSSAVSSKDSTNASNDDDLLMDYSISMSQVGYIPAGVLSNPSSSSGTSSTLTSAPDEVSLLGTAIIPMVDVDEGNIFVITDFVTGVIEMNRAIFSSHLSEDMRRKSLFGSDQIIS